MADPSQSIVPLQWQNMDDSPPPHDYYYYYVEEPSDDNVGDGGNSSSSSSVHIPIDDPVAADLEAPLVTTTTANAEAPLLTNARDAGSKERKIGRIKNEALVLGAIYFAYQSMVLISILTVTKENCHKFWVAALVVSVLTIGYWILSFLMAKEYIKINGGSHTYWWFKFWCFMCGVVGLSAGGIIAASLRRPCG